VLSIFRRNQILRLISNYCYTLINFIHFVRYLKYRLIVFVNRMLKRIFGPMREELAGVRTRLHNEVLHNQYASPNIIRMIKSRRMRWAGHVARMGKMRNAYNVLNWKPEWERLLGRSRCRWEDNIGMVLGKIVSEIRTGCIYLRVRNSGGFLWKL
jgi:hypothetical protein